MLRNSFESQLIFVIAWCPYHQKLWVSGSSVILSRDHFITKLSAQFAVSETYFNLQESMIKTCVFGDCTIVRQI